MEQEIDAIERNGTWELVPCPVKWKVIGVKCIFKIKYWSDGLLEKHGTKVWGRVGDRDHLLTANEPGVEEGLYPRDLYFENEEDRQL